MGYPKLHVGKLDEMALERGFLHLWNEDVIEGKRKNNLAALQKNKIMQFASA